MSWGPRVVGGRFDCMTPWRLGGIHRTSFVCICLLLVALFISGTFPTLAFKANWLTETAIDSESSVVDE